MLRYLLIAFGSALGGMARYWCTGLVDHRMTLEKMQVLQYGGRPG